MAIRLLLADDHVLFRAALKLLLTQQGFEVIGEASTGREAIAMAQATSPDVALIDIGMPLLNGIDASREIAAVSPRTKVICLTMQSDDTYTLAALRAGVKGYVLKSQAAEDLVQAICAVARGDIYLSPGISASIVSVAVTQSAPPADRLTQRERQVLQLLAEGKSNKEIAQHLEMSVKTVESHRANLMKKLDLHETASLVRHAVKIGLIQL